jgi:holliday junction DNA helicase RuvB
MPRAPKAFYDLIGQERIVKHLTRLIDGARILGKPCPSLLLSAPVGYGKTTCAEAVAAEVGTTLFTLLAGKDVKPVDLCAKLSEMECGDVLFLDEGHALSKDAQQLLYVALDQEKVPMPSERGLDRSTYASIAPFTLILATNEPGKLLRGLRNRLERVEFDPYTIPHLKEIVRRVATRHGITFTGYAARRIAETAQGTPRNACRRFERLQLYFPLMKDFGKEQVEQLLVHEGIDTHGLWPHQRQYLVALAGSANGACTLDRLTVKIGCDPITIRQEIEPYLLDQAYVEMHSNRGRTITAKGRDLVAELEAALEDEEDEA